MSYTTEELEEVIHLIHSVEQKTLNLKQDKEDGEDIGYEKDDVKEMWDEANEAYKETLKHLHGEEKIKFSDQYGAVLTKVKQLITKL